MGKTCCVPACMSNASKSDQGRVSFFHFPKCELKRQAWLNAIPRKDFVPTKFSFVCSKHFNVNEIKTENKHGSLTFPLKFPQLLPNVVPIFFQDLPEYYSKSNSNYRKCPSERKCDILARSLEVSLINDISKMTDDLIGSFDNFKLLLVSHVSGLDVEVKFNVEDTYIYKINVENFTILQYIRVSKDLICRFYSGSEYNSKSDQQFQCWSQFKKAVEFFFINTHERSPADRMNELLSELGVKMAEMLNVAYSIDFKYISTLEIISDQLKLMLGKKGYSENTLVKSFLIYLQSPVTYHLIRDQNMLILPSKSTLQRLTCHQNLSPTNFEGNKSYLFKQAEHLKHMQRKVIIQIDEMYLKAQINYKSQKLTGYAQNNSNIAKTVIAFLVSSAFGNFKEIVALHPVNNPSGDDLHKLTLSILKLVQSVDLEVISIVTDNHRINQNMFSTFAPNSFKFINPDFPSSFIFLMYDPVHIFKNIRNNWINKKDSEKSFYYPDFEENSIKIACFKDIRDLYKNEEQQLVKKAYKLNKKTVFPSLIERQNVQCVANVFHESTIIALETTSDLKEVEGTVVFLKIIKRWWNIVNCKSVVEGIKKREPYRLPIYSIDDAGILFLRKFLSWIERWMDVDLFESGLTITTFKAIHQSVSVLLEIAKTYINDVDYIMFGKFQTDNLERRFSWYRRLSGCTFHVSYTEVVESEIKLRLKNCIKSETIHYELSKSEEYNFFSVDTKEFAELFRSNYLEEYEKKFDRSAALYICGYAAHSISKQVSCLECQKLIRTGKGVASDDDYFNLLNKGGLSVPTEIVLIILMHMGAVFEFICSNNKLKSIFLNPSLNQKKCLSFLTVQSLMTDDLSFDFDDSCACGKNHKNIYYTILSIFSNILLNNFSKHENNNVESDRKRKLKTFENSNKTLKSSN